MGIQDRDYWHDRQREQEGLPPRRPNFTKQTPDASETVPRRRFRVIDEIRHKSSVPVDQAGNQPPERMLGFLTWVSALVIVFFIAGSEYLARLEEKAAQKSEQIAAQISLARIAETKARLEAESKRIAEQEQAQKAIAAAQFEQRWRLEQKLKLEADRKSKRDAAWQQFYQPTQQCQADWTIECANVLIRARSRFDAQYNG